MNCAFMEGVRGESFESYYFQASDGGVICAEVKRGLSVLKILKGGRWESVLPGLDFNVYDFNELVERGRKCI